MSVAEGEDHSLVRGPADIWHTVLGLKNYRCLPVDRAHVLSAADRRVDEAEDEVGEEGHGQTYADFAPAELPPLVCG